MFHLCAHCDMRTYEKMPFLKPQKITWSQQRIKSSVRDGWRHAVYLPETEHFAKTRYTGEWRHDKREGKGIGISSRGWMYEGDWRNDQRHGYGILSKISKDGDVRKVYAGDWMDGKRHGFGSNWYKDGTYYEGIFRRNIREGYGQIWYECDGYYQGTWANDQYHGEGMLVQGNGNIYEGQFVNGKKEGKGVFYHLDSREVQEGCWKNDVCMSSTIGDIGCRRSALRPSPLRTFQG